jgi:hypothetical protein
MQTILTDITANDLVLDVNGNIAVASEPYSLAQDAASAIKTFLGEAYFDKTLGVPYFADVLGKSPPVTLLQTLFNTAAETVPDVATASTTIASITSRLLTGQVEVTSVTGQTSTATFTVINPQGVG